MAGTSTPGSLSDRLRKRREEEEKRIEAERQRVETLITTEFGKLGANASSAADSALRSIESDLEQGAGRVGTLLLKAWARSLAIAISLLLGISIGSWGLAQWLSLRARALAELEARIEEQERTLELLEGKSWGLELREASNGRYVVLPKGARVLDHNDRPVAPAWTLREQPAIKLELP